jgi:hypothetical protein
MSFLVNINQEEQRSTKKPEVEVPKIEPLRVGDIQRPDTVASTSKRKKRNVYSDRTSLCFSTGTPYPVSYPKPAQGTDKATDDYHYEKFKKAVRRYR